MFWGIVRKFPVALGLLPSLTRLHRTSSAGNVSERAELCLRNDFASSEEGTRVAAKLLLLSVVVSMTLLPMLVARDVNAHRALQKLFFLMVAFNLLYLFAVR